MDADQLGAVGIVVPARDEADSIEACVMSIRRACWAIRGEWRCWIVVVADSCTDSTAARARCRLEGEGEVLERQLGSVGAARRIGVSQVLRYLATAGPRNIWLANTDADSQVPAHWLQRQLDYYAAGYQAVAGTVSLAPLFIDTHDVSARLMADYSVRPDGSHPHVHGSNLGVRADAYSAVGGWCNRRLAEDHCLWGRLGDAGWRLISASDLPVRTSARLQGRARGGFAATLAAKVEEFYA